MQRKASSKTHSTKRRLPAAVEVVYLRSYGEAQQYPNKQGGSGQSNTRRIASKPATAHTSTPSADATASTVDAAAPPSLTRSLSTQTYITPTAQRCKGYEVKPHLQNVEQTPPLEQPELGQFEPAHFRSRLLQQQQQQRLQQHMWHRTHHRCYNPKPTPHRARETVAKTTTYRHTSALTK